MGSPREEGFVSVVKVLWGRTSVCSLLSMPSPIVSAQRHPKTHEPYITHTTQKAPPHPGHLTSLAMSATRPLSVPPSSASVVIPATLSIVTRSHPCTGHLVCLVHGPLLGPAEVEELLAAGHACVRM